MQTSAAGSLQHLSEREQEILWLIGQGKTSKDIARTLNISILTVGNHRKHICDKLHLHSTAELAAYAGRHVLDQLAARFGTPCSVRVQLRTQKGTLMMTYRGHLSRSPAVAKISIGEAVFHF